MSEERYTLSSLLREVLGVQDVLRQLYDRAAESDMAQPNFPTFSKEIEATRERMEEAKSEGVIELALEPIPGEKISELLGKIRKLVPDNGSSDIENLKLIEKLSSGLFDEAAKEIAPMSAEVSQLLLKASKQSRARLENLSATPSPSL